MDLPWMKFTPTGSSNVFVEFVLQGRNVLKLWTDIPSLRVIICVGMSSAWIMNLCSYGYSMKNECLYFWVLWTTNLKSSVHVSPLHLFSQPGTSVAHPSLGRKWHFTGVSWIVKFCPFWYFQWIRTEFFFFVRYVFRQLSIVQRCGQKKRDRNELLCWWGVTVR
jgi:hypothetical protein